MSNLPTPLQQILPSAYEHSAATARHVYEDELHLSASSREELEVVNLYNNSDNGKAVFQVYNSLKQTPFILCIVTNLMKRVHEKIYQASELCYFDASAAFDQLNTSITLLYTNCAAGALPLGIFLTSDESDVTIKNALNLLKEILPDSSFYGRGSQLGPAVVITDDSYAESYHQNLLIQRNHTNNYVERSFGLIKDLILARTQAYNAVQIFHFITANMEQFYERRLIAIANRHPGHLELSKRFLCPG
ncbi:36199_t:CDS:2 [Gigaspora margarita]|uniref:36199_t:CDS:1 n=1 Tax=Gigaspora margarita TaxID=4874 RepID=A0ABN7UCA8_GIGMA|nr:36199_t:CDS:2 [Gigaspora margarita]